MISEFISTGTALAQLVVGTIHDIVASTMPENKVVPGVATLTIIGGALYFIRRLPRRIWNFCKRWLIFTHVLEYSYQPGDSDVAISRSNDGRLCLELEGVLQAKVSKSRPSSRVIIRKSRTSESISDGSILYRHKGTFLLIRRNSTSSKSNSGNGATNRVVTIAISTLRWKRAAAFKFIS